MSSGGWVRIGDPASRSWSPLRLSGACGPAGAMSAAVRKDLNLNLSAVHEKIRSRAYGQRFRNRFRVKASGSIGPMCFKSGAVACAPPIVRDESSRVFLGGALQQSPPLRRPSSMVGQFSLEVNRKDEPAVRRRRCCRRQNRQKCGPFIPALTVFLRFRSCFHSFSGRVGGRGSRSRTTRRLLASDRAAPASIQCRCLDLAEDYGEGARGITGSI
jgi:hypothetical protein